MLWIQLNEKYVEEKFLNFRRYFGTKINDEL